MGGRCTEKGLPEAAPFVSGQWSAVSGRWKPNAAGVWQGTETQLPLLTHHQPGGWSPALEKGGYTLGLTPIAFYLKAEEFCAVLCIKTRGPCAPRFYPPFSRAGDRCACAMVVG